MFFQDKIYNNACLPIFLYKWEPLCEATFIIAKNLFTIVR